MSSRAQRSRPNLVLIMVDQWRGDCLSGAGHPVVHTPYLDQLALRGVRFDRAYSAVPSCIAARAGLFTGLTPRTHGRVGYRDGVPWDYRVTLAGELTAAGYQTQAVGKMHVFPERSQLGFQNVLLHDGPLHHARRAGRLDLVDDYLPWLRQTVGRQADHFDHGVNCNSIVARPWDKEEALHPTTWVASQSIDFLRRRDPRKPFFLFMSFHRPHPPYDPPAWALEQCLDGPEMPEPPRGDWLDVLAPYATPRRPDAFVDPSVPPWLLRRARAGYYGHMSHIDHQVNRFLESLIEYGLDQDTAVIFVSDHGEMIGDHTMYRKAYPYEGSARVPLIIAAPPALGLGLTEGGTSAVPVELRDIMPTLLEIAGAPVPASVEGRSFLPAARGSREPIHDWLHGEHTVFGQSLQWLTDGHGKYVWWSGTGREQLFDLDRDPQELHDLAAPGDGPSRCLQWRERLIRELRGREEGFTDGTVLIPGRPVRPTLAHLHADDH